MGQGGAVVGLLPGGHVVISYNANYAQYEFCGIMLPLLIVRVLQRLRPLGQCNQRATKKRPAARGPHLNGLNITVEMGVQPGKTIMPPSGLVSQCLDLIVP